MSDSNLLEKINNWLLDEGLTVSKRDDETSDFHLVVQNIFGLGFNMDIVKIKNKPFIVVGMGTKLPLDITQGLSKLKTDDKRRFLVGLQKELLKFGVEHKLKPTLDNLELVEIHDIIYVEETTRPRFMNLLKRVKHASLFFRWSMIQKFTPSESSSKSPSVYG